MSEYDKMSVGELRKALRAKHPECRGAFAAQASKYMCLGILEGKTVASAVIQQWHASLAVPAEGAHGENAPAGDEPLVAATESTEVGAEALGKMLAAIGTLNPAAAAEIERLRTVEQEMALGFDKSVDMVVSDGKVTICGIEVPMVLPGPTYKVKTQVSVPADPKGDEIGVISTVEVDEPTIGWDYVPAIDPEYRFEYWQAKRKCGAITFKQDVSDMIDLLLSGARLLLTGPPAVGKTSAIEQLAARCNYPVTRFNGNRDITVQDFVGNYEARDGCTVWVDGPLPRAMKEGHILILDEVDHMPAECSSIMHAVLEPNGKLIITSNGGEVVEPSPNFRIVATANTSGFGDESGLHPNAQVQDAAFLSRFDNVFRVSWMEAMHEKKLLQKASGIAQAIAAGIVKVANDTRKAVDNGDMLYPITLRQTLAWARTAIKRGSLAEPNIGTGFALSVLNKLPETDAVAVSEIAQRHFGEKLEK